MRETKDIWLISFLKEEKKVEYTELRTYGNKTVFCYDVEEITWKSLKEEFGKSIYSKIKWNLEKIKDLIF